LNSLEGKCAAPKGHGRRGKLWKQGEGGGGGEERQQVGILGSPSCSFGDDGGSLCWDAPRGGGTVFIL